VEPGARYVALGSSFAAGPGIAPPAPGRPRGSLRSAANYPALVAARLGLHLVDVSFSGATTRQLLTGKRRGVAAQLDAVTADTRLVTLTSGGNDVGYIGGLTLASLPWPVRRRALAGRGAGEGSDERFARLAAAFDDVLAEVRRRAPGATVLLVDYPAVVPPEGGPDAVPLRPEVLVWARDTARLLAGTTAAAAQRAGYASVAVSAASAAHHAWSARPWTTTGRSRVPFHPTAAGMRGAAGLVLASLGVRDAPGA